MCVYMGIAGTLFGEYPFVGTMHRICTKMYAGQGTSCQSSKFTKVKISCGHIYHRACIDEWLRWKKECPICKVEVELKMEST